MSFFFEVLHFDRDPVPLRSHSSQFHFFFCGSFVFTSMSMSKTSSPAHARELQFLRALQSEGRFQQLIYEMQSDPTSTLDDAATGAMHDGSKRRLDQWEEVSSVESNQIPVTPGAKNIKVVSLDHPDVDLPPGVDSVDRWGETVNTMGKYASLKMSYRGMVDKALKDAEKGDREFQDYLHWVKSCSAKQSAKGADFAKYLKAIGWGQDVTYGEFIPGTTERRQFI